MAYTTIDKPTDYFETKLYTGNGGTNNITGLSFAPDWVWLKERGGAGDNRLFDTVRGATNDLVSNTFDAEADSNTSLTAFNSDGFTLGNEGGVNNNTDTFVSWNWLAGGTTASNTDGSITSTVSANTTSGFSIVSYTGTGATATVGHGLGVAPNMVIIKNRTDNVTWIVGHDYLHSDPWNDRCLHLDTTSAFDGNLTVWSTPPTSTLVNLGFDNSVNGSSDNMIAYCFAEKKGFSKFGSYTGNGNSDGSFVYLGFKPAWVMIKRSSDGTDRWTILDNKRDSFNVSNTGVYADDSQAENSTTTEQGLDILSNGFKIRNSNTKTNTSGATYIYMAFAESPFVTSTGIPTTAR